MWQNKRSFESELLDQGASVYTQKEYDDCLALLARVNRLLGGFKATKNAFLKLKKTPKSILEVGCGGGYLTHHLHAWFPEAEICGIDICPQAIDHAEKRLPEALKRKVAFSRQNDKTLSYLENHFDVVTTLLVTHHMTDEELILFLQESYRIASHAVIINDLQRHLLAYLSFSAIAPFAFPNRLIWHDGRLSIRRSFRRRDWVSLLQKAGLQPHQYCLRWHWAFRWTLTLVKN